VFYLSHRSRDSCGAFELRLRSQPALDEAVTALRNDAPAADNSGMLAKHVGLTLAATGFAVAFAAVFGRRPTVLRGAR